jgi:predicted nucleic acid-binding protein
MADPFLDTDVIIRYVTGDDPDKQARAAKLFENVESGKIRLVMPLTVVADAVHVLASPRLYNRPRSEVASALTLWVKSRHIRVPNRRTVLRALELFGRLNLDFGDCVIIASMEQAQSDKVYSFDEDFDRIKGITRVEP